MDSGNSKYDDWCRYSVCSTDSSNGSPVEYRQKNRFSFLWRSRSLSSLHSNTNNLSVLSSIPFVESCDIQSDSSVRTLSSSSTSIHAVKKIQKTKEVKNILVTIIVVEARGLPSPPDDGVSHSVYGKIRLGSKTFKTKMSTNTHHPEWKERFEIRASEGDLFLEMTLRDKGKEKNYMGSCVLDLSGLMRDRTHDIWQQLGEGYGSVHLSVTVCNIRNLVTNFSHMDNNSKEKYALHNLTSGWNIVGQLNVKVIAAKGLSGKPNAYCTLEVDNQRVQTHNARSSSEPSWEKSYVFNIYDISSTLDLKIYDGSLKQIRSESLGRVIIPLLRISNRTFQWYALKDRTKRQSAKGNCPRVLLDMSLFWNPVKAAVRLFQPKEVKYIKRPPKFDAGLVISNMEFVSGIFQILEDMNESFKRLFEWDNRELSFVALLGWLFFWYNITLWGMPLVLLLPFLYYWTHQRNQSENPHKFSYNPVESKMDTCDTEKDDKTLTFGKLQGFPELTLKITSTVEYVVSLLERIFNLVSFKVSYLSYLAMLFLIMTSLALYFIPFNYMMIALGIYKFARKYLDPERKLNNDLLDFISRVPDNEVLKDWKELSVPEPVSRDNPPPKHGSSRPFSVS